MAKTSKTLFYSTIFVLSYGSLFLNAYFRGSIKDTEKKMRRSMISGLPHIQQKEYKNKADMYKDLQMYKRYLIETNSIEQQLVTKLANFQKTI